MVTKGGSRKIVLKQITKAMSRHPEPFQKFCLPTAETRKSVRPLRKLRLNLQNGVIYTWLASAFADKIVWY